MKTTKRLWPFVLADNKLAEEYLERQASKGLILDKIGSWGLMATYRREAPQERHFCVEGFKGNKEEHGLYVRMAKDAGWDYVTGQPGHIFFASRKGESPVPMQTDWREEYLQIRKGLWSYDIPLGILQTVLTILTVKIFLALGIDEPLPLDWAMIYAYAIELYFAIGFVKALMFYLKSEIALRRDEPMKPGSMRQAIFWGYLRATVGVIMVIGIWANAADILLDNLQTGDSFNSVSAVAVVMSTAFVCAVGTRISETDELGRRVLKTDQKSQWLWRISICACVATFIFFCIATFSAIE